MKKLWHSSYPKGVPVEIDLQGPQSIMEMFEIASKKFSDHQAFSSFGVSLTYRQIDEMSEQFAAFLQDHTSLKKGDRIAIQLPNILQFPIAVYGAQRAGLVVVNTNPLYTEREMLHQAIVICSNFADKLERILEKTSIESVVVTEIGDLLGFPKSLLINSVLKYVKKMVPPFHIKGALSFSKALDLGAKSKYVRPSIGLDDVAFLQYTGGTTGVSKGAVLTQRNVLSNTEQIYHWMKPLLKEGQEVVMAPLPMYHIFSLTLNLLALYKFGAKNILVANPRDIPGFIKILSKEPFTVMTGVNTLYNALMNNPQFSELDFSYLKISVAGGMAMQVAVAEKWKNITGTICVEGYGLTEASPVVCCGPVDGSHREGSIGLPLPSTDVKLCDEEGVEVPVGEHGELWVRGPQVMMGYWQKPAETTAVLSEDGWLRTGDIAKMDEAGFFKIIDRIKDMILVSGFNVYPNEVEAVIAAIPGVLEVGVIGVEDEKSGEVVKAFVVSKDSALSAEAIIAHCRKDLTSYKVPRFVEFRDELPKTNVGKILRRELR
jgi:long-chain acyl-CoA synthetase